MRAGRAYDKSTTATVGRAQFCQCVSRIAEHLGNFWMSHGTTISIGGWKYMRFIVVALVTVPNLPESLSLWYNFDITIHCMFILSTVQSETFPDVFVMGDGHTWGRTSYWLRGIPAEWGPYITKFGHWLGSLSIHNIIHILYYHIKKCPGLTLYICISIYCIKIWTRIGHWKKIPNWSYSLDDGQFHPIPHPSHSRMVVYNVYIFTLYIMYIHIIFSLYRYYIYIDIWYVYILFTVYNICVHICKFSVFNRETSGCVSNTTKPYALILLQEWTKAHDGYCFQHTPCLSHEKTKTTSPELTVNGGRYQDFSPRWIEFRLTNRHPKSLWHLATKESNALLDFQTKTTSWEWMFCSSDTGSR